MKKATQDFVVYIGMALVLVVWLRPGSAGTTFVATLGNTIKSIISAATGGGSWWPRSGSSSTATAKTTTVRG